MSRMSTPSTVQVQPTNNIYTGLAFISMIVMLGVMAYCLYVRYGGRI